MLHCLQFRKAIQRFIDGIAAICDDLLMSNIILIFLALFLAGTPLRAQDIDKEVKKPARAETEQKEAERLAAEAAKRAAPGEEVAYEQVLADPDNVRLNYGFARSQVRRGDIKGAAATLERILLVDPKQGEVRLFYAIVLYRLDNMVEAKAQLDMLKKLTLPQALRDEADKYAKAVEQRVKRTHLSGSLSLGFEYDTNRNAAPASGRRLFSDTPLNLTGSSKRRDDTSLVFMGNVGVRRNLPCQSVPEIFGSFAYYQAEQTLAKNLNLKAYSAQAGGVYKAGRVKLTPAALFDHVQLAQSTFLRNRGADLRLDYRLNQKTNLFFSARDVYQDFVPTKEIGTAPDRTGIQVDFTAGADNILNPAMKLGTSIGHGFKHATRDFYAFDRWTAGVNHTWLLGRGAFLLSSFNVNYDLYRAPDTAISVALRKDTAMRANATLGAPLAVLHPRLQDLVLTFTYEYYHALSTVENYAYSNNKVAAMLNYRWEVGL